MQRLVCNSRPHVRPLCVCRRFSQTIQQPHQKLWNTLLAGEVDVIDDELVTVLKLRDGVQWSLAEASSELFVRKCNLDLFKIGWDLASTLDPIIRGYTIYGNPGIGKSWFLSYWLYRLAQEQKTVCFESMEQNGAWLFQPDGTVSSFNPNWRGNFPQEILMDSKSFYLFDPAGKNPREPTQTAAFTVVAASSDPRHYFQFNKRNRNKKFIMPPWTEAEIDRILPHLPHLESSKVKELFAKYGPIPLYILNNTDDWHEELERAISTTNPDDLRKSLGGPEALSNVSHKLLHCHTGPPYTSCTVTFASPHIGTRVANELLKYRKFDTLDFIATVQSPDLASVRGLMFTRGLKEEGLGEFVTSRLMN